MTCLSVSDEYAGALSDDTVRVIKPHLSHTRTSWDMTLQVGEQGDLVQIKRKKELTY